MPDQSPPVARKISRDFGDGREYVVVQPAPLTGQLPHVAIYRREDFEKNGWYVATEIAVDDAERIDRIMAFAETCDWDAFARFVVLCHTFDETDDAAADFEEAAEAVMEALRDENSLLSQGPSLADTGMRLASASDELDYAFGEPDRFDAIHRIFHHERHDDGLSWNIKVYAWNNDGTSGSLAVDRRLDPLWIAHRYAPHDMGFGGSAMVDLVTDDIRQEALREYLEDEYTVYPGEDQGRVKFEQRGRQGGHLVLTEWRGTKMTAPYRDSVLDLCKEMSDADLRDFYKTIVCLDADLANPAAALDTIADDRRAEFESDLKGTDTNVAVAHAVALAKGTGRSCYFLHDGPDFTLSDVADAAIALGMTEETFRTICEDESRADAEPVIAEKFGQNTPKI